MSDQQRDYLEEEAVAADVEAEQWSELIAEYESHEEGESDA